MQLIFLYNVNFKKVENDTIVFDLESQKEFAEVGRDRFDLLKVSVLSAFSYKTGKFFSFEEKDLGHFEKMLKAAELVIGFNIKHFDFPVLQPYLSLDTLTLPVLDLMDEVVKNAGFRVSLDNLCQTTINAKKSAHGLEAIKWYREGKIDEIKKYCTDDVRLTRDLYEFGKKNGYVTFFSRDDMDKVSIPVSWNRGPAVSVRQVLNKAFEERRSVEIDYITRAAESAGNLRNTRLVDIHRIEPESFEGYCHLRKALRVFKIERVLAAKLTPNSYQIEGDLQGRLL